MGLKIRGLGTLVAAVAMVSTHAFADRYDNEDGYQDGNQQQYQQQYDQDYQSQQAADPNAADQFQDQLSPYGEWVSVEGYGRVWRPYADDVGSDFRPYASGGNWVYTDYGWSFDSSYPWAWATFHYGRWMSRPGYGWLWVPGSTWAPAWVDWRFGGGYVGWVPLGPYGVNLYAGGYRSSWCFVQSQNFVHPNVGTYVLPPSRVNIGFQSTVSIHNAVAVNGVHFNVGPSPQHIATAVGQPIRPVSVVPPAPGHVQPVHIAANVTATPRGNAVVGHAPMGTGGAPNRAAPQPMNHAQPVARPPAMTTPVQPHATPQQNAPRPIQGNFNRPAPALQRPTQAYNAPRPFTPPAQQYARTLPMPQQHYQAPVQQHYQAPVQQHYQAPVQQHYQAPRMPQYQARAPAPSRPIYNAPAYRNAPSAPAFHGGGAPNMNHRR